MKVLFLAYANNQAAPLPSLQREDTEIYRSLSPRAWKQHFYVHREPYATIKDISEYLVMYRNQVSIFLFSGHAGRDNIMLSDQEGRSEGLVQLLAQCPQLKLVILNGCSTRGQVQALWDAGIPIVIATSAPVEDEKAANFSIRFFQTLAQHGTYSEAFEFAVGETMLGTDLTIHRDFEFFGDLQKEEGVWGIFCQEKNKEDLQLKLPAASEYNFAVPEDYKPNERLTTVLWEALAPFSSRIKMQKMLEEDGDEMEKGDKQVAVINSLPRPIGWHLRKLMAPIDNKDKGYDKLSPARLKQMAVTYETVMEFVTYILLAQLWNTKFKNAGLTIDPALQGAIKEFVLMKRPDRPNYNFVPLICDIARYLEAQEEPFFVDELGVAPDLFLRNDAVNDAVLFFNVLRRKMNQEMIDGFEVKELCIRGEESLVEIIKGLAFLSKYVLATVKYIDVERYLHLMDTNYRHIIVKLMRVFGDLQEDELNMKRALFNRSVLLLKKEGKADDTTIELNLTPLVFDENAFKPKTDLSKLYFFSVFRPNSNTCYYKNVSNPDQQPVEVSDSQYELMKTQFDIFKAMLWENR